MPSEVPSLRNGGAMDKYIINDMFTEKLKREIGMVSKPFPEELKILEAEVAPFGKSRFESSLYQTEKLKKIAFLKHTFGETFVGTVVIIVAADEYDLPFIVVNVASWSRETSKIFAELGAKPLVWDEESTRKYDNPFREWLEAIRKLPSEPIAGFEESGEHLKAFQSPIGYQGLLPVEYLDKVLNLTDQFFNIFVNIHRKAEPVEDVQRRRKMDAFRSEYNRYALDEDPSGMALIAGWGREKAQLFFEHLVNM